VHRWGARHTLWGVTAADRVVVPSREDPVARSASVVAGGPLGRYAVPLARGWRSLAAGLIAASCVPMALSVAERGYCIDAGWSSPDQFFHMCFSDLPATFGDQNLSAGLGAFLAGGSGAPTPVQPPLTALLMAFTGGLVPDGSAEARARFFFGIWAVLIALLLALTVWFTAASVPRMPLRAAHVALSPVVALTAVLSPDLLGVALASAALWAWSRSRPVISGVLFGLAISARSYPVLLLVAIALVAVRAGRGRTVLPVAGAAIVTFAAVAAALALGNPSAAMRAYSTWVGADAGFGSPWVVGQLSRPDPGQSLGFSLPDPFSPSLLTLLAASGWLIAILVGTWLAWAGDRRPGVAEVALVMVAIVLMTGKSFPVQSSLWLVPLVALVGITWRDHLIWSGAEALHFGAVWLYLAGSSVPDRGLPSGWYLLFLLLRLLAIGWLVLQTWWLARDRLPQIFSSHETDPLAGPLRDAPDALIVRVG
jgi:hypothetical protein